MAESKSVPSIGSIGGTGAGTGVSAGGMGGEDRDSSMNLLDDGEQHLAIHRGRLGSFSDSTDPSHFRAAEEQLLGRE